MFGLAAVAAFVLGLVALACVAPGSADPTPGHDAKVTTHDDYADAPSATVDFTLTSSPSLRRFKSCAYPRISRAGPDVARQQLRGLERIAEVAAQALVVRVVLVVMLAAGGPAAREVSLHQLGARALTTLRVQALQKQSIGKRRSPARLRPPL